LNLKHAVISNIDKIANRLALTLKAKQAIQDDEAMKKRKDTINSIDQSLPLINSHDEVILIRV
jgi:hypothetical protein